MQENKVVGYSWTIFFIVLLAQSISLGLGLNFIVPFLTTIAAEMKLTSTQVGTAWGMIGLGALLFSIVGGLISDRIGVRWTGFLGLLLMALGGGMRGIARNYPEFLASMFLFGLAMGLARPNFPRVLSQWFPRDRLGTVNGILSGGTALAAALAFAISVSIIGPLVGGWRNIAIVLGTITFVLAIAWAILVRERVFGERTVQTMGGVFRGLGSVLRLKSVWILSIVGLLLFGHSGAWASHMPGFFEHKYGMTTALAGQLVSVTLFAGVIAAILGPTITDRTGLRKPAILIACVMGGLLNMIQGSFLGPVLFVILTLMPFGLGTIAPLLFTIPFETKELPHAMTGAAIGVIITFQNLGATIYPVISGKLIDLFAPNYYPYFAAQMLAFGLSFLMVWLLLPETGPQAAKAAASRETADVTS